MVSYQILSSLSILNFNFFIFLFGLLDIKTAAAFAAAVYGLVELLAILAGSLGLLAALDAGALVMLTLTDLGQHAGLGAAALEALQGALQRLVLSDTDFRHLYFPPSGAAGRPLPRKGHIYGFNSDIIFIFRRSVKSGFMNAV